MEGEVKSGTVPTMKVPLFHVDAFAAQPFAGNPAAVCVLERWLPDATLLAIAAELNLSETAFVVPEGGRFHLRWFTPVAEMDLCGHATLATAHVLMETTGRRDPLRFRSMSGELGVRAEGARLALDFPSRPGSACEVPDALVRGLGARPQEVLAARDYLCVLESEAAVRALEPDFAALATLERTGIIATAPGTDCDFVSRFFCPKDGIPEDPVTGSAHCTLVPYWSKRLGKTSLHARQVSARGGELFCENRGARVSIAGHAVTVSKGELLLPG